MSDPPPEISPDYQAFLASKAPHAQASGIEPGPMHNALFDYQRDVTAFCLRQGRAALFLDTGLGKSACILEWCDQASRASNGYALILTPLAVAKQFEREAQKFGYDARVIRDQSEAKPGINVCNYDRLGLITPDAFGAVALDESSVLKNFSGSISKSLIAAFSNTPFRLCSTATPAPNDHMELGQHAEFLGVMPSNEMLARWFISDQTEMGKYRLKKHGEKDFWDWMASWSRAAQTPADLGFDGSRFVLPELKVIRHQAMGDIRAPAGALFLEDVSAINIHAIKRQTAETRANEVARVMALEPNEPWVIWCDTDYESDALKAVIPGVPELKGSMSAERKEEILERFLDGGSLITKPSITSQGVNWQHCARTICVGRSFSYEQWYQLVRRFWRFGQSREVHAHLIVAEGENQIGRVIDRKAGDHQTMKIAMTAAMKRARERSAKLKVAYQPNHIGDIPQWLKSVA